MADSQLVSTGKAAKHLRVTRQWILKLIKAGRIKTFPSEGSHNRVTIQELKRFAADNDMKFYELGQEAGACD